jgi:hypothetical protein
MGAPKGSELHGGTSNKLAGHYRKFIFLLIRWNIFIHFLRHLKEHLQYKDANSPKWVTLVFL